MQQRRGAGFLGELQWARGQIKHLETAPAHIQRALHGAHMPRRWSVKTTSFSRSAFTRILHFSPPFFSCVLPASRLFLRARLCTGSQIIQAGQCGNQIGADLWEVVCDKHGIGGDVDYCEDYDAQLDCTNVLYHEVLSEKYVYRAVLFDLEPGVIEAERARRRSASSPPG
jgi:hypothetical protein